MFEIESQELDHTVVNVSYKNQYYEAFIDNIDMDLTQALRVSRSRMKSGSLCYYLSVSKNGRNNRNSDHRFLHLMIVERILNRPLKKIEAIHHLDANSFNCRRSNFLLMTKSEHARLHASMSSLFAKQVFESPMNDEKLQLLQELLSRNTQVNQGIYQVI